MLRELIPGDLIKIQSANDWKRSIIAAYNQDAGKICTNNLLRPQERFGIFIKMLYLRHESRRCENYIFENRISMADIRLCVLRGKTEHGTELSRIVIDRHQQARREPHTSSIEGNHIIFFR